MLLFLAACSGEPARWHLEKMEVPGSIRSVAQLGDETTFLTYQFERPDQWMLYTRDAAGVVSPGIVANEGVLGTYDAEAVFVEREGAVWRLSEGRLLPLGKARRLPTWVGDFGGILSVVSRDTLSDDWSQPIPAVLTDVTGRVRANLPDTGSTWWSAPDGALWFGTNRGEWGGATWRIDTNGEVAAAHYENTWQILPCTHPREVLDARAPAPTEPERVGVMQREGGYVIESSYRREFPATAPHPVCLLAGLSYIMAQDRSVISLEATPPVYLGRLRTDPVPEVAVSVAPFTTGIPMNPGYLVSSGPTVYTSESLTEFTEVATLADPHDYVVDFLDLPGSSWGGVAGSGFYVLSQR
ncbi:MAG: hypothetical protein Q8P41_11905 [Pseudomonadota bacterium]|nr:hypothetical protein [Pseudomonadota bacterium]